MTTLIVDYTKEAIKQLTCSWPYKIERGVQKNTPLSATIAKEEWEHLTCEEHNLMGTGAGSHSNDHNNGDETKGVSQVQAKDCNSCHKKLHFFTNQCECGCSSFEYHSDSRWGIDTKAHFEYNVPKYHLWVLRPQTMEPNCKVFTIEEYIIDSQNKNFNEILKIQYESPKSKHKNLVPFSSDFYASNPVMSCKFTIELTKNKEVIVERNTIVDIVYDQKIIKKIKSILSKDFLNNKDNYRYDDIKDYINVRIKKTSHGKNRGKTKRRN